MGQMDFISSIFVRFFFSKLSGKHFNNLSHVTDVLTDQSPLFVHSTLILKQWKHSGQRVCIHVPCCHAVFFQKVFRNKQCNFWSGFNVHDCAVWSMFSHTGQCKRTGGCYNELVVAFFSTGGGVKGKKIYTR